MKKQPKRRKHRGGRKDSAQHQGRTVPPLVGSAPGEEGRARGREEKKRTDGK